MLNKCAKCEGRFVLGWAPFLHWKFCSEACSTKFKVQLADQLIPEEEVKTQVETVFNAPCKSCGKSNGNDFFSTTKVTGMMIAWRIETAKELCCSACGRWNRVMAALYCFFLGWWSPVAAVINIFAIPTNIVAGLFIRQPKAPSNALVTFVKCFLIDSMQSEIAATHAASKGEADSQPQLAN